MVVGMGTATTSPRALISPRAEISTSTTVLRPRRSLTHARNSSSGPKGVGRRKFTLKDAVT